MKKKNVAIIVLLVALFLIIGSTVVYRLLQDKDKLTVEEKEFITSNENNLINVNVDGNINIFSKDGDGVFYDFLDDEKATDGLQFNIVTNSADKQGKVLTLTKGTTMPKNSKLFFTDHFVLVGKKFENISNLNSLSGNIGLLDRDRDAIIRNLSDYSLTIRNYKDRNALLKGLDSGEVNYILVPRIEYLDTVLEKLYAIDYHFSDIKDYYYIGSDNDKVLTSIIYKFYNKWEQDNLQKSMDKNAYTLFTEGLRITEKDLDTINKKNYIYGFIPNKPYDVMRNSTFGGISYIYLNNFSNFSGIKFQYRQYKNINELQRAISKNEVNLYMNYYSTNLSNAFTSIDSNHNIDISILMNDEDKRIFTTLKSLSGEEVYAKKNSRIFDYLKNHEVNVKPYDNDSDVTRLLNEKNIVAMDKLNYLTYNKRKDVNERMTINTDITYNYMSNNDTMFNRLLTYYLYATDKNDVIYDGLDNSNKTIKSGTLIYQITKYALLSIAAIVLIGYLIYRYSKKIHIRRRIKKADKMKYIDMLTSLKNRNFLSESVPVWNRNTIYPQSIIVVDINNISKLNDSLGYAEGDKEIKAVANILVKTQLDNSEIMRTSGDEFTIYMVGYSEKKVLSYIKKLNKEFKNLPHNSSVAIGFSMIEDDVKLVDDAINEATDKMKKNKEIMQGESDEDKI